jgi:hypothetical protein
MLVNVFGKTANAIAAHLDLAAIRVVDLHFKIGNFGGMNGELLIRADAETAVAKFFR